MNELNSLTPLARATRRAMAWLFRAEFDTPYAAPLPGSIPVEVGTLTTVDPGNSFISGGFLSLRFDGVNIVRAYGPLITNTAGLAVTFAFTSGDTNSNIGFLTSAGAQYHGVAVAWQTRVSGSRTGIVPPTSGQFWVIIRDGGGAWIVNNTTLITVGHVGAADVRPGAIDTNNNINVDYIRACQLGGVWLTRWGLATARIETVSAGDTISHQSNGWVEYTWTPQAGQTLDLDIRRTDADNRWVVRCSQGSSNIQLIERNGGVETLRSTAAQSWTAGTAYRIQAVMDGAIIRTYVGTAASAGSVNANNYTSATFNQTATQARASLGGSNLVSWPRTLPADALAELAKWTV